MEEWDLFSRMVPALIQSWYGVVMHDVATSRNASVTGSNFSGLTTGVDSLFCIWERPVTERDLAHIEIYCNICLSFPDIHLGGKGD